jgi:O-antigen/teichoic acid export membrane protein
MNADSNDPVNHALVTLRSRVTESAILLTLREGAGVLIGLIGVVALTRMIGPGNFGLYAAAVAVYGYLNILGQWGLPVFLVRREGEVPDLVLHQAITLAGGLGVVGLISGWLLAPGIEAWARIPGFASVGRMILLALPGALVMQVPRAILGRRLEFKAQAGAELAGQIGFYLAALPLAALGAGVWAAVAGWWAQLAVSWPILYRAAGYRPRLAWDGKLVREMLRDGMSYTAATWAWQARTLVNPLLVGRYVGVAGVGYVDLAVRFVDNLGFVKTAASRVAVAALAQVQQDTARLRSAVGEGARLQVLALGVLLVGFGVAAPWLIPLVFGEEWLSVLVVYPFIALGALAQGLFNMEVSGLYVLRQNAKVLAFHLVHVGLFAGTAVLGLRGLGLVGYGWGEVAAILSYPLLHTMTTRRIGAPSLGVAFVWAAAFACAVFATTLGWWMALPLLGVTLWPRTWRELRRLILPQWHASAG